MLILLRVPLTTPEATKGTGSRTHLPAACRRIADPHVEKTSQLQAMQDESPATALLSSLHP